MERQTLVAIILRTVTTLSSVHIGFWVFVLCVLLISMRAHEFVVCFKRVLTRFLVFPDEDNADLKFIFEGLEVLNRKNITDYKVGILVSVRCLVYYS